MAGMRRVLGTGAAALVALGTTTACEGPPPPPPPAVIAVTTTVAGRDAVPGDGACEVTPGAGDCTLWAAIDEGNALGRADLAVPAGYYPGWTTTTVTGDLRVNPGAPVLVELESPRITVAEGASLHLDGVTSFAIGGPRIVVEGAFVGEHLSLVRMEGTDAAVRVAPTGRALLQSSLLAEVFSPTPGLRNEGVAVLRSSTLYSGGWADGTPPPPALSSSGSTFAVASVLLRCTGAAPISLGHNAAEDATCALDGPGDLEGPVAYTIVLGDPVHYTLDATSPLVDAVPVGFDGCGAGIADDLLGVARPADGDGDGTAACDIGAVERPG